MPKIIHNVALLASLVALTAGLWQGWGAWLTVKHMGISYLAFYFLGAFLVLAFQAVPGNEKDNGDSSDTRPLAKKR